MRSGNPFCDDGAGKVGRLIDTGQPIASTSQDQPVRQAVSGRPKHQAQATSGRLGGLEQPAEAIQLTDLVADNGTA